MFLRWATGLHKCQNKISVLGMKTIMIVMVKREVCGPSRSGDNLVARHGGDTGTPLTLPLTRAARDQESLEAGLQRHTQIEAHRVLEKVGKCQKISWNS